MIMTTGKTRGACARAAAALVVALALAASSRAARAQSPGDMSAAEGLFSQGSSLVNAGRYDEGCPKLAQAQALVMGIGVTLYLGECYEHGGEALRAWQEFKRAEQLAAAKGDHRQRIAHDRAERLWLSLAKIAIVVEPSSDVPGLIVTDDGVEVPRASWGVARPVEPRVHRVRAAAPDRTPWDLAIEIPARAQTIAVDVPPLRTAAAAPSAPSAPSAPAAPSAPSAAGGTATPAPAPAPPPSPAPPFPVRRAATFALLGAGALGIGLGVAFGLDAKSKLDDSNSSGHCRPNDHCDADGLAERSSALTAATVSSVSFIAGAVCIAGGVTLVLTSPRRDAAISLFARTERAGASVVLERRW
jgi:hypothetical protein